MRALHNAENIKLAEKDVRPTGYGRRFISMFLCLSMVVSMICGTGVMTALSVEPGPTENIVPGSRVADPDTMDDYLNRLLNAANGSRYAGRVWTDKTVFAFGDTDRVGKHFDGNNTITLDMATDGYEGSVGFNADFAHVFSALASSQVVNEYPPTPIDLVIVFDMSGSMGQDTRYDIDNGVNTYVTAKDTNYPEAGVPMAERIANSRIQKTLDAINQTIDKLMEQNPQNRVAVCGYGANAVVLMPLGHYKKVDVNNDGKIDEDDPYISVGGMETLYHPSDLVYRQVGDDVKKAGTSLPAVTENGWYWMNNRDTCYTVVVNAEYNTYTGVLNNNGDGDGQKDANDTTDKWTDVKKTVSNNVLTDDGTNVKAFPGDWDSNGNPTSQFASLSKEVYEGSSSDVNAWSGGANGYTNGQKLRNAFSGKNAISLKADDYVGYFTNTQGGIYLAYKQLADSKATTYTEQLTNGVMSTVARIPAAIIMSDGGANFSFNEMGQDSVPYTADDWNARYGQRIDQRSSGGFSLEYMNDNSWTTNTSFGWNDKNGKIDGRDLVEGRYKDARHRLGGTNDDPPIEQDGDEWYNVFIPGKDTLGDKWNGLHGLYNQGADIFEDGTLSTPPYWNHAGVFYNSDNSPVDAPGTILEVLLTAAYMHDVVKTHYNNGWTTDGATEESKSDLFTYTMSVDTEHVPQWGKMRLYPTLDPKEYPLDTIQSAMWYKETAQFGDENLANGKKLTEVYEDLYNSWIAWKNEGTTEATIANENNTKVTINSIASAGDHTADYETEFTTKDGKTQKDIIVVTDDDVVKNIAYNDEFFDVTSENLDATFDRILALIRGNVFAPVSGDNDAGVGDSVTYQDPIGEYMEIKNGSIIATPHHVDGNVPETEQTYDMALLLFGEMHGLVRTGVYDWHWNDEWMKANNGKDAPDGSGNVEQGVTTFPEGWYKGNAADSEWGGSGAVPSGYDNANAARADGWIYRMNYKTAAQFIPLLSGVTSPDNVPEQMRNTVYTMFRFAGSQTDRNKLRRNPVYGEGVPEEFMTAWEKYYSENGGYPEKIEDALGEISSEYPGIYRLSDIRVWVEETGDYVDTDGAITPNSGYDRSLYVNIPAAAVPTELATITLGKDGVLSYETNLGSDHMPGSKITVEEGGEKKTTEVTQEMYENFCYQSTPFRLFYAVGLEEELILRDEEKNQIGVDFTKISPEYIKSHTVEGQDYVWFISNYYSGTQYGEYATDAISHTRGDPTVTFSPGSDNRYYVFQKPLPLYAHAYRVQADGTLKSVDKSDTEDWKGNRAGNGSTTWENYKDQQQQAASWIGGRYMGTYASEDAFKEAVNPNKLTLDSNGKKYITDSSGIRYEYVEDGIVFLQEDMLEHVTSTADGGYTQESVSFSSDDYFFILVEFYVPDGGVGMDNKGAEVPGSYNGYMVQYALARKGSEFGSGFASGNIDNGDMLCWTDNKNVLNVEFEYLSKSDTGDLTRGEPTFEKLTKKGDELKNYLMGIGLDQTKQISWTNSKGEEKNGTALEQAFEYWQEMQENPFVKAAMNEITTDEQFKENFKFSVAARPGGIRSGDMSNNIQYKGDEYNSETQLYNNNVTKTSNTYYLPTVSDNSGTDDSVIIDNYLGNNGRLEIANQMLHVTKMLEVPEGFELTEDAKNETFNYQIYVQGVTGTRSAIRTQYNEYSGTWERVLAYIDVLTDNSSLLVDNSNNRALFISSTINGTGGTTIQTAKQVILHDGSYYEANEDGTLTFDKDGKVDETVNKKVETSSNKLYYLYLPSNGTGADAQHTRRLYQNQNYDGSTDGYEDKDFEKNGTTTFVNPGDHDITGTDPGAENRDSYRETVDGRPAGTKTYWAQDAELIPVEEVQEAENVVGNTSGEIDTYALESVSSGMWTHTPHESESESENKHISLQYYSFVIRRPSGETSETAFESPFATRSKYMTVDLVFGENANANDGSTNTTGTMTPEDVYDQIIPTADRPDLFSAEKKNDTAAKLAPNTAEFTLKHGEGLLLSGLDNRITYRFTEKLTDEQLAKGYTLKRISHIQQRGSESIYLPGVQDIPIYSEDGATYGSTYGDAASSYKTENGLTWKQDGLDPTNEPFAHTNAIMWEYYATMAEDTSGNHHQPSGVTAEQEDSVTVWDQKNANTYQTLPDKHTVSDNPSCVSVDSVDNLEPGKCDIVQTDGTTLHYMYYKGQLIDPHYEGEASTYLRNMARYGVSPTVHFGVSGEKDMGDILKSVPSTILQNQSSKDTEYYDYTGIYSVYGNTGWFEEQANFVNTINPEMLVVTKQIVDETGEVIESAPEKEFTFTLTLTPSEKAAMKMSNNVLYMWKGLISDISKSVEDGGAPTLDKYTDYIAPTDAVHKLTEISPDESTTNTYTVTLKANEAVVFYGIPVGTKYTVTEEKAPNYPIYEGVSGEPSTPQDPYTQEGTIEHYVKSPAAGVNHVAMRPSETINRNDFYNQMKIGTLTVEKEIRDDDGDTVQKEFTFNVTLTPETDGTELITEDISVVKYGKDGQKVESFDLKLVETKDESSGKITALTAEFKLKHGEKVVIDGIPYNTKYTVTESDRDGYNLEYVVEITDDPTATPDSENFQHPTDFSTRGVIDDAKPHVYWLFVNAKPPFLPFTGGNGSGMFFTIGAISLIAFGIVLMSVNVYRKRRASVK